MTALHWLWVDRANRAICDCPVGEDHNESAWRTRGYLDDIGCPCDRRHGAAGIHDAVKCPHGRWRGPL